MGASISGRFYFITNTLMILVYAIAGIGILFWNSSPIPYNSRKIFSIALIAYSFYRGFVMIRRLKNAKAEN